MLGSRQLNVQEISLPLMGVADPLTHIDLLEMHALLAPMCLLANTNERALPSRVNEPLPGSFPPELFSHLLAYRVISRL